MTPSNSYRLRPARPADAAALSALALRSKAHWGYDADFMAACEDELSFTADAICGADRYTAIAETDQETVGFYTLERLAAPDYELQALFVEPVHIGQGAGRMLISDAIARVAANGGGDIIIQGDPHAARFYEAAGAIRIGSRESGSIQGRFLPLFSIAVTARGAKPECAS